jgi:hypothetical protein
MVWIGASESEGKALQELYSLADRAAAIVAGALLDVRLETALRLKLRNAPISKGESVQSRMFEVRGALNSFSVKIDLGFMMGMYSDGARRDMTLINKVRNQFAHRLDVSTFDSVKDLCANLSNFEKHFHEYKQTPAQQTANPMMAEPDLAAHLQDPRQRYLMAVRLYFTSLGFPSQPPGI